MNNRQKIIIEAFGLGALTTLAYAATIPPLSLRTNTPQRNPYPAGLPQAPGQDAPLGYSALGTAVWDQLVLASTGSFTFTDPVTQQAVKVPQLTLDTVLVTIERTTKIVTTSIQGRDNDVVEYINKGNWTINIKGGVYGSVNQRPQDQIAMLQQIEAAKIDIPATCNLFKEWNIDNIVIKRINLPTMAGSYSFQVFEMEAISDVPFLIAANGTQITNPNAATA